MSSSRPARARFTPDPRVGALIERHGAPRVGLMFGLDADAMRRYEDGASQRTTRWWIETHLDSVVRDFAAESPERANLVLLRSATSPPGEPA